MALRGEGPEDLVEETVALAVEMVALGAGAPGHGGAEGEREGHGRGRRTAGPANRPTPVDRVALERSVREALASGKAAEKFQQVIEAQGGDPAVVEDPSLLPQAKEVEVYYAPKGGTIQRVEPRIIGRAIIEMGGGRTRADDDVDPTVGFVITARPGQPVHTSEPVASIFARDRAGIELGRRALDRAIGIGEGKAESLPLVAARVTAQGVEPLA